MIDTVVFKLIDVRHNEICKLILKRLMSLDTGEKIANVSRELKINVLKEREIFNEKLYRNYSGHISLPSSTYDCFFSYNDIRDCIEFNMSIPKAVFATNAVMFTNHNPFFLPYSQATDKDVQVDRAYDNLINFFTWFLVLIGGLNGDQLKAVFGNVIITSIHLCVNQIFDSKTDALRYIECLKRTRKKKSRELTQDRVYDTTGVYYASDNFTVKVYHKGSEFLKNDRKELIDRKVFPESIVDSLQAFADRTVRYEMEFRNKYISSIYFNKIFRHYDVYFLELKFCNTLFKRKFFSLPYVSQVEYVKVFNKSFINFDLRSSYVNKYIAMWKNIKELNNKSEIQNSLFAFRSIIKKNSELFEKYENKTLAFGFLQSYDEKCYSESFSLLDRDGFIYRALFSKDLFNELFTLFWAFVDEYEIKESLITIENSDTTQILTRIFKKNGYENKRIAPYIGFYNMLQTGKTYKEIRLLNIYNDRTLKRYIAFFKKLNIDDKCVDIYNINVKRPLISYFNFIFYKNNSYIRSVINYSRFNFK